MKTRIQPDAIGDGIPINSQSMDLNDIITEAIATTIRATLPRG